MIVTTPFGIATVISYVTESTTVTVILAFVNVTTFPLVPKLVSLIDAAVFTSAPAQTPSISATTGVSILVPL